MDGMLKSRNGLNCLVYSFVRSLFSLLSCLCVRYSLKQNESQSPRAESRRKGVNSRSKDVTQTQQQRPESPTVTLTGM